MAPYHFDKELIFKYFQNLSNQDENQKIHDWLNKEKSNKDTFLQYKAIWDGITTKPEVEPDEEVWAQLESKAILSEKKKGPVIILLRKILPYAAIILLTLAVTLFIQNIGIQKQKSPLFTEIVVPKGSKTKLTLPDGTKVWLNAGSVLKYSDEFNRLNREVHLYGEGFFDVAKNPHKTFVVETGLASISALGTQFNVKAYPEDKILETTLVEGKVKISDVSPEKKQYQPLVLEPNQTVAIHKDSIKVANSIIKDSQNKDSVKSAKVEKVVVHEKVNVEKYTSWKDGKWILESELLGELAVQFERLYDVNIIFSNENIKNTRFTGTLRDESLEQVLNAMKLSANIDFEVEGKQVILKQISNKID